MALGYRYSMIPRKAISVLYTSWLICRCVEIQGGLQAHNPLPLYAERCIPLTGSHMELVQELGAAALSKRPTSCMLVLPKPIKGGSADDEEAKEYAESYGEVEKKVKAVMPVF
jgi:H/ACA ribonucleoprotein complex subunit 2